MMATAKRRIEVTTVERERIIRQPLPTVCPVCQKVTELLTVRQAAALAQVRAATIRRWLAAGKIHGVKTAGGQHRLCRASLFLEG
jgi:excisionase family DNA binding protein